MNKFRFIRIGLQYALGVAFICSSPFLLEAQPKAKPELDLTFTYHLEEGTNGCAVTYVPDSELYYAVIAGNEEFPLEVFYSSGEFFGAFEAGIDTRGLWYNSKKDVLEGNGPGETGIFRQDLEKDGGVSGKES